VLVPLGGQVLVVAHVTFQQVRLILVMEMAFAFLRTVASAHATLRLIPAALIHFAGALNAV
jgi:hypothetical protein